MISWEEAHSLIEAYRSERTRLRIVLILRDMSISMRLTATALPAEEESDEVTFVAPNGDCCLTVLRGCRFEYGDAREVKDPRICTMSEQFAGCLTILFPSGERLALHEMR